MRHEARKEIGSWSWCRAFRQIQEGVFIVPWPSFDIVRRVVTGLPLRLRRRAGRYRPVAVHCWRRYRTVWKCFTMRPRSERRPGD